MKPVRIQRRRTKGSKMPENTINVTRPGKWGNPFKAGHYLNGWGKAFVATNVRGLTKSKDIMNLYRSGELDRKITLEESLKWYRILIDSLIKSGALNIEELRGKNLACFCKEGEPCHADVLLELANK